MHPIFLTWQGDHEALRATGIGLYGNWHCVDDADGVTHAIVYANDAQQRPLIAALDPNIVVMPGPNGKLQKSQLKHLKKAKEGDAFRDTLLSVYQLSTSEHFNPDNF